MASLLQNAATGRLTVLDLLRLFSGLNFLDLGDDVFGVRKSLTLQFREDQITIHHYLKRGRTAHLSADDGGRTRIEEITFELIIARAVASGAAILHIHLDLRRPFARHVVRIGYQTVATTISRKV